MGVPSWTAKVYRLRRLPHHITDAAGAAHLLGAALGIPPEDVVIYSVACTFNRLESPPSKVATLQLKSSPSLLQLRDGKDEWKIPLSGTPDGHLLLDAHFLGMTVLNDVDTKAHHTDCIAISGLASHPFGSWQPHGNDKTFMWIRDEASRLISGTRMILYGYDSQLIGSQSFQRISDISLGLIHQLKNGGWGLPSSKPIVFLAHSLGGIVLKDAIVQIAGLQLYASILDKVKGAIMFGVPSLGMYQSHLRMMTEGQPNDILIQDLSRDNGSAYLRRLNTRFDGLSFLKNANIYWAYETKESATAVKQPDGTWAKNGPPEVLVNPDSATSYRNTKNKIMTIPIDKDHSTMVKFSSGDKDLETILHILSELCDQPSCENWAKPETPIEPRAVHTELPTHRTISSSEKESFRKLRNFLSLEKEMYANLYSPELGARVDQIEDPYKHTFGWIFELKPLCHWLQDGSGLFWINGKPGSGKSTLMKHIYQSKLTWQLLHSWTRSSAEIKEIKAGFFFHYRGTPLQKSFEGLLRSLIVQILDQMDTFRRRWRDLKELDSLEKQEKSMFSNINLLKQSLEKNFASPISNHSERSPRASMQQVKQEEESLARCQTALSRISQDFKAFHKLPATEYLVQVVSEYHSWSEGLIPRLEKVLRMLLYQDIIKMDVVLFFDALDEYDGHTDMIAKFLHNLVQASTSSVRVKICFSSRPWEALLKQFSGCPGLSLQDHTKADIEIYTARRLGSSTYTMGDMLSLVPLVVAKASGVFVWVKLAITEVINLFRGTTSSPSIQTVEKLLLELPEDLHSFYELIVERIAVTHRRYTFALLELIIRQNRPQGVKDIWRAVHISRCSTLENAIKYVKYPPEYDTPYDTPPKGRQTRNYPGRDGQVEDVTQEKLEMQSDIFAWGGGLVEIQGSVTQLMHQTVLEFVLSLDFKRAVLGDLAAVVVENGHSYHLKFLIAMEVSKLHFGSFQRDFEEVLRREDSIRHHSQQSELTTGQSELRFIESVGQDELHTLSALDVMPAGERAPSIPMFASFHGLGLCLKSWLEENPRGLRRISSEHSYPLLVNLFFSRDLTRFQDRYMDMATLVLVNGFNPNLDRDFFRALIIRIWDQSVGVTGNGSQVPLSALYQLVTLVLNYKQDPNVSMGMMGLRPLHMAPPALASELIQHGADPNCCNEAGETPLSLVLGPQYFPTSPTTIENPDEWRYQIVETLLKAGAKIRDSDYKMLKVWLDRFDDGGFDTSLLRGTFTIQARMVRKFKAQKQPQLPDEDETDMQTGSSLRGREGDRNRKRKGLFEKAKKYLPWS